MTLPFMWALIALKRWMNCPGLTPLAPRAGPIGGAGVAVPPGAWSLNWLVISFLAMTYSAFVALRIFRLNRRLWLNDRRFDALASQPDHVPEGGEGAAAHDLDGAGRVSFRP